MRRSSCWSRRRRLWRSLGHHDAAGSFRIDGVTGPDEYTAIVDNNVYTNLMAARNLRAAADAVERHPDRAGAAAWTPRRSARWRDAADAMVVPYDEALGVHPQSRGLHRPRAVGLRRDDRPTQYPLLLHYPYFDLYRKQVVKQADLVLALHLRGDALHRRAEGAQLRLLRAAHRARLVAVGVHAGGDRRRGRPPRPRLRLLRRGRAASTCTTSSTTPATALHIASLAGAWIAAVAGFGGMRDHGGELTFVPRLPDELTRLRFRLYFRGRVLEVVERSKHATYTLHEGEPLELLHHGEEVEVSETETVERPIPRLRPGKQPRQPRHREPFGARGIG